MNYPYVGYQTYLHFPDADIAMLGSTVVVTYIAEDWFLPSDCIWLIPTLEAAENIHSSLTGAS